MEKKGTREIVTCDKICKKCVWVVVVAIYAKKIGGSVVVMMVKFAKEERMSGNGGDWKNRLIRWYANDNK